MKTVKNLLFLNFFIFMLIRSEKFNNQSRKLLKILEESGQIDPKMNRLLKIVKKKLKDPVKRVNFVKALNVIKQYENNKKQRKRKLAILGMTFLDDYVPLLKNETFTKVLDAFLIFIDKDRDEKYERRIQALEDNKMMTNINRERKEQEIEQLLRDLEEKVVEVDQQIDTNIDNLKEWIEQVDKKELI